MYQQEVQICVLLLFDYQNGLERLYYFLNPFLRKNKNGITYVIPFILNYARSIVPFFMPVLRARVET